MVRQAGKQAGRQTAEKQNHKKYMREWRVEQDQDGKGKATERFPQL